MKRLDVSMDVQPGWLYLDVPALEKVFGKQNMRWFFPLHTFIQQGIPVAGGADHMIGHGKDNAVNPYNPFLNMWMCISRKTREGETFYPEEKVTREDALRLYTNGAAWIQFAEKERGSLESGKLADLVVIDRDYLTCPEEPDQRHSAAAHNGRRPNRLRKALSAGSAKGEDEVLRPIRPHILPAVLFVRGDIRDRARPQGRCLTREMVTSIVPSRIMIISS